jgi:hypothetical protein
MSAPSYNCINVTPAKAGVYVGYACNRTSVIGSSLRWHDGSSV